MPEQSAEPRPVERLSSFLKERGLGAEDLSELKQILNDLGVDDDPPGDESDAGPGPDFELEEIWAPKKKITRRTSKRYRDEPDGLPYLLWGNRVWIHKPGGEDFIRRRIKYPNRRRGRGRGRKMRDAAR